MNLSELKRKEVINSCNCKILGCANDVEFDLCSGCIHALIVPGPSKFFGLICSDYEYVIPHKCITQVGPDIILVDVDEQQVRRKVKFA